MEDNKFSILIYSTPEYDPKNRTGLSLWLYNKKYKRMRKHRYKYIILREAISLRWVTTSFETLCDYADFLKEMELVFQYSPSTDDNLILFCDSSINQSYMKKTLVLVVKDKFKAAFTLSENDDEQIINIKVESFVGNKIKTTFNIVNAHTDFDSVHNYNLLNNINKYLREAMYQTFIDCYNSMNW